MNSGNLPQEETMKFVNQSRKRSQNMSKAPKIFCRTQEGNENFGNLPQAEAMKFTNQSQKRSLTMSVSREKITNFFDLSQSNSLKNSSIVDGKYREIHQSVEGFDHCFKK